MDFYSRVNRPKTIPHPRSSKIVPTYSLQVNKDTGKKEIVESGKTNIYDMIQASKDETMVYNILKRFQNGDIEALSKTKGVYGDFTNAPKTLAEAHQLIINAENHFNDLPLDVRKEFNYSSSEYLASLTNGKFEQIMAKYVKQPEVQQELAQPFTPTEGSTTTGGIKYE